MSTLAPAGGPAPRDPRVRIPQDRLVPALVTCVVVLLVGVWSALGALSLPGLALAAACLACGAWLVLTRAPWLPMLVVPVLIPLPQLGVFFPFEMMLAVSGALLTLHLARTHPERLWLGTRWEAANACFVGWALFTTLWAFDGLHVFLGVRRLLVGVASGWIAYRMAGALPRRAFETSLLAALALIAGSAFQRSLSSGFSAQTALFHRASATDMGWGTANYIASLILLLSPIAFSLLLAGRPWWMRTLAAVGLLLAGLLQVLVASRAATVLFFLGLFVQAFLTLRRRARWTAVTLLAAATTVALVSPYGQGFLARFSNIRDLGSMVVRLWYFREGWRRVQEFFWFGMGLNQGIPYPDKMGGKDLHNYWLVITSELGVIGLTLWIVTLVLQVRVIDRMRRLPGRAAIGSALLVSFALGQIHTLVEPTFQGVQYQFLWFWIGMGFLGYARCEDAAPASKSATSER